MDSASKDRVVLFADLVGSTNLYEQLGDAEAKRIVSDCLLVARNTAEQHHGVVTAELGDEIMIIFPEPAAAAAAACEIHAKMAELIVSGAESYRPRLRIGMHYGPVGDVKSADVGSETARIAHWATSNAKPEQSLGTAAVIDRLPRIYQAVSRYVDDETWNFVSLEHLAVHEIIWDIEGITAYKGEIPTLDSQKRTSVTFACGDTEIVLDCDHPVISIGRSAENDLVVAHEMASRQHLSAQFSRGRCSVTDNSTNGTVVISDFDNGRHDLRRESFTLLGSGRIYLGQPEDIGEELAVTYRSN